MSRRTYFENVPFSIKPDPEKIDTIDISGYGEDAVFTNGWTGYYEVCEDFGNISGIIIHNGKNTVFLTDENPYRSGGGEPAWVVWSHKKKDLVAFCKSFKLNPKHIMKDEIVQWTI